VRYVWSKQWAVGSWQWRMEEMGGSKRLSRSANEGQGRSGKVRCAVVVGRVRS
jgi:hypothetical protein